jgi:hypothetical protein
MVRAICPCGKATFYAGLNTAGNLYYNEKCKSKLAPSDQARSFNRLDEHDRQEAEKQNPADVSRIQRL